MIEYEVILELSNGTILTDSRSLPEEDELYFSELEEWMINMLKDYSNTKAAGELAYLKGYTLNSRFIEEENNE